MAVLTGLEIQKELDSGRIVIDPFNKDQLNIKGISYDLTLQPKMAVMKNVAVLNPLSAALGLDNDYTRCIDGKGDNRRWVQWLYDQIRTPMMTEVGKGDLSSLGVVDPANPPELFEYNLEDCPILVPGVLYLASTVEKAGSDHYEPILHGKSSLARLGLSVHETAGLGEPGWKYQWTLEMTCSHPIRLYPNMRIAQIVFETVQGEIDPYDGNYVDQEGPTGSRMHTYFKEGKPA